MGSGRGRDRLITVRALLGAAIIAASVGPVRPAVGQENELRAYRIPDGNGDQVRLDGLLTEDLWSRVPVASGFTQREPEEGQAATERTEVRVAYDDEALYIAGVLGEFLDNRHELYGLGPRAEDA